MGEEGILNQSIKFHSTICIQLMLCALFKFIDLFQLRTNLSHRNRYLLLIFYATSFQVYPPQIADHMGSRDGFGVAKGGFGFANLSY